MSTKNILFWGPQCVEYWNKFYCAPVFERLKRFGWRTRYYFPPANEFGTGLNSNWREWFYFYDQLPDYKIVEHFNSSVFFYHDANQIAEMLKHSIGKEKPDIIITRATGHDYLRILFPGIPILTMGESIGAPWYAQPCFSLTPSANFHGLPHLSKFPYLLESLRAPSETVIEAFHRLNRLETLPKRDLDKVGRFCAALRQKYEKVYLFCADYTGPECPYLYYGYDNERFTTNADIIHHFLESTGDSCALLVTQHPYQSAHNHTADLSTIFSGVERIITSSVNELSDTLFRTELLSFFCDGLIIRNSKSFWYAVINDKPLLNLGSQDLSIVTRHTTLDTFLETSTADISITQAQKILYWHITRQRIALTEIEKLSKILSYISQKAKDSLTMDAIPELFEWGSDSDYHKTFSHCIDTFNTSFHTTKPTIESLMQYENIWLYGASGTGEIALKALRKIPVNIKGVVDSFKEGCWNGFRIQSPKQLKSSISPGDAILVASDFWENIKISLDFLGVENETYTTIGILNQEGPVHIWRM